MLIHTHALLLTYTKHTTLDAQSHTYDPYEHDEHYGGERQRLCGLVCPGHRVDKAPHHKERHREEAAGEDDIPDPVMAAKLLEHVQGDKARHEGGEGIEQDTSRVHGMVSEGTQHNSYTSK